MGRQYLTDLFVISLCITIIPKALSTLSMLSSSWSFHPDTVVGKLYQKAIRRKRNTAFGQRMEEKNLLYKQLPSEVNEGRWAQKARIV